MKRLLTLLIVLLSVACYGQRITDNSTRIGYLELRAGSYFHLPEDTILSNSVNASLNAQIAKKDGAVYQYHDGKWLKLLDDNSVLIDSVRRSNDTLYFRTKPSGEIAIRINYSPSWAEITDKPATFPPSAHTHVAADVTDFTAAARTVISGTAPITYSSSTGAIGWNGTTSNVPEGMNLYFSNARVQSYSDTRYTPLTRELSIGTGMTGGGDLSADRSFGLDFSYLDDRYLSGYKQRAAVRVATTANITLSGLQTIDGVSVAAGDRVLVKNQTSGAQNGIYNAATGSWTRATDFDAVSVDEVAQGSQIFVSEGTVNNKTGWSLATGGTIVLNTTPLTFIQYSGANSYEAGTGLTLSGNSFSAQTTANLWNANKLQGVNVTTTAPTSGQLLRYDGTTWSPWTSNYLTGELDLISQSKTVSLTAGTGIGITGGTQTVGSNPAFTITNTGTLSNVLTNGNTANSNITLGSPGFTSYTSYNNTRNISGVDYTLSTGITSTPTGTFVMSNGTAANNKILLLPFTGNTLQYSPDNGSTVYNVWHAGNHQPGSAFNPDFSGARVLQGLQSNASGHIVGMNTRILTPGDIGAAPATGSGSYVQNTTTQQASSDFNISGTGRAVVFKAPVVSSGVSAGAITFVGGDNIAGSSRGAEISLRGGTYSTTPGEMTFHTGTGGGNTVQPERMRINAGGTVTMNVGFKSANASGIFGTGTGVSNLAYLTFLESNGTTRAGYVGKGSGSNSDIYVASDAGGIALSPTGTGGLPTVVVASNNVNINSGLLNLTNSTSNFLQFPGVGLSTPSFASRSVGTRIVLSPNLGPSSTDYAIGMESSNMWFSASGSGGGFKWYAGTANIANLRGTGDFELAGQVRARGWSTAGTGAGLEMGINTGAAGIQAYDRTAGQYLPLNISAGDGAVGQNFRIDNAYHFNIAGTEAVTISQGILSVGNNSPSTIRASPLQVQGNAWATDAWILGTGTTPTAEFGLTGTNSAFVRTMGTGDISFMTSAGTVRAKISGTTGNIIIGNTTDDGANRLQVTGSTKTGGLVAGVRIITASTTVTASDYTVINKAITSNPVVTFPSAASNVGKIIVLVEEADNVTANGMAWTPGVLYKGNTYTSWVNPALSAYSRLTIQSDGTNWVVISGM